jgi:hypothetical protein
LIPALLGPQDGESGNLGLIPDVLKGSNTREPGSALTARQTGLGALLECVRQECICTGTKEQVFAEGLDHVWVPVLLDRHNQLIVRNDGPDAHPGRSER